MVFKNFKRNIVLRVLLLSATLFLLFLFLLKGFYFTSLVLFMTSAIEVYSMVRYVNRTNRDLAGFLESIRFSDFSRSFEIKGMGESFNELYRAFNHVIDDFQKVRAEKEEHYQYLQSLVQHIDVCVLAYLPDGKVEMINTAAKKLFRQAVIQDVHKLSVLSEELVETLLQIKPGETRLVKVRDEDDLMQLAINTSEFKIRNKTIILATIKNIQHVLEDHETDAWQKLIRVLTHEIMNSITPISSLSATLEHMLKEYALGEGERKEMDAVTLNEIRQALETINKRSTGLLHFVNTYRNLTRIPEPSFRITPVADLFKSVTALLEKECTEKGIIIKTGIEPQSLELSADGQLIEQVLINLVRNSITALEGRPGPCIELRGLINKRGRPTIQVTDNGMGILSDVMDKIFIPFFTTRPNGSGIGLSLSRQILRLHGGTITAHSVPEKETVFTLTF